VPHPVHAKLILLEYCKHICFIVELQLNTISGDIHELLYAERWFDSGQLLQRLPW